MLIASLFLVLLGIAAAYDLKTKTIPDWVSGLLWVVAAFFVGVPNSLALACCMLGVLMIGNTISFRLTRAPIMEWGDVLILPPFFASQVAAFGETGLTIAAVCLGVFCFLASGKKIPLAPILLFAFVVGWILVWVI